MTASPHAPRRATGILDGLGRPIAVPYPPRRIVSLVPSLTEALFALGLRDEIVAVTKYCVEPAGQVAAVAKVGGTKNPELDTIRRLQPDLVVASAEENVREHVEALIGAGLTVYVSLAQTVRRAITELHDLARLTGRQEAGAGWLAPIAAAVDELEAHRPARAVPYFCPIWRRPYMVAGPDTYMTDLLRLCGGANIYGAGPARYYPVEPREAMARGPEVVLLPSEPYPFAEKHRVEVLAYAEAAAVRGGQVHLVDGQLLTWYGPRIGAALSAFAALLGGRQRAA